MAGIQRGSLAAGPARVQRVPRTSCAALAAPRGSIPSGSDVAQSLCGAGPRGSTQVLEEAILESCSLASCTTQPFVWRGSTRVPRREAVLFAWRRGHHRRGATRVLRSCRGSHAGHAALAALAALAASRVHSIRKRCGSIVWRGSTRVLEEARERV